MKLIRRARKKGILSSKSTFDLVKYCFTNGLTWYKSISIRLGTKNPKMRHCNLLRMVMWIKDSELKLSHTCFVSYIGHSKNKKVKLV